MRPTRSALFVIPLANGRFAVGQVLSDESKTLGTATVALFRSSVSTEEEAEAASTAASEAISVLFVARRAFGPRKWRVIGHGPVSIGQELDPTERLRRERWVGATIFGSETIARFVDAYFGLGPWNGLADPHQFDHMLLAHESRPPNVVMLSADARRKVLEQFAAARDRRRARVRKRRTK